MERRRPIPGLDQAVEVHSQAIARGEYDAAESLVAARALETHRAACANAAAASPIRSFEVVARAKLGSQFIVKVRWHGAAAASASRDFVLQNRWAKTGDKWQIVEVDDLSIKRSPWSDTAAARNA